MSFDISDRSTNHRISIFLLDSPVDKLGDNYKAPIFPGPTWPQGDHNHFFHVFNRHLLSAYQETFPIVTGQNEA